MLHSAQEIRGGKTVDVGLLKLKLKLMGRAKLTAGCSACLLTYLYSSACLPDAATASALVLGY
jgi:hypothetical protein